MKLATKTLLTCASAAAFAGSAQAATVTATLFDEVTNLEVTGGDVVAAFSYGDSPGTVASPINVNGISHLAILNTGTTGAVTTTASGNVGDFRAGGTGLPSGDTVRTLFTGIVAGGSITIDISGLTIGETYLYQAYWEHRNTSNLLDVTIEGVTTTGLSANTDPGGTLLSVEFIATDNTLNSFFDYQATSNNWISGFSLQVVPEPGSLALLGLGGLLIGARRRRA